jgi:hypothetical protein
VRLWSAGIALISLCLIVVITFAVSMLFLVYCIVPVLMLALSLGSFSMLSGIFRTVIDEGGGNETANKRLVDKLCATRHMVSSSQAAGVTVLTAVALLFFFMPDHKYEVPAGRRSSP